jgi:putative hydrolase of the HAD superfamily
VADEGIAADEIAYRRARSKADNTVRQILASEEPGTDDSRIFAWFVTLLTALGVPADRLEAVGADIRGRHAEGTLWTYTVPGTLDMLRDLKTAGLRLAVISNADGRVAQYLAHSGLADEFEFILDSGTVGIEKPDRRIFEMALERLGLGAEEVVYVGDSWEIDVVGATSAGIRAIYLAPEPRDGAVCITGICDLPSALGIEPASPAGREPTGLT